MSARGSNARAELEDVTRRVYALTRDDQLRLFATLRKYLADEVGVDTAADRQITARAEALAALRATAAHLSRSDAEPLTVAEFNAGAREPGLEWSSARVIRAWRRATNALTGERVRETPAQRSLRRATSGKSRTDQDYAHALREWLRSAPTSDTRVDYDARAEATTAGSLPATCQ